MMVSYAIEPQTRIDMPGSLGKEGADYTGEGALTPGDARAFPADGRR
jgi:hypothetical protein